MERLLHNDPDVAARLRSWGVKHGSDAYQSAARLFLSFDDMVHYVRVGYLKSGTGAGRGFFSGFLSGSRVDKSTCMGGEQGLALAQRFDVQRSELSEYAQFVSCWNRYPRAISDPDESMKKSWETVFRNLRAPRVRKLVEAGDDVLSPRVAYGVHAMLEDGLTPDDINTYLLSFHGIQRESENAFRNYFLVHEVCELHSAGVPAAYAMGFTSHDLGFKLLPVILQLWKDRVPVEYAVSCLLEGHSVTMTREMFRQGISLEYATSLGAS